MTFSKKSLIKVFSELRSALNRTDEHSPNRDNESCASDESHVSPWVVALALSVKECPDEWHISANAQAKTSSLNRGVVTITVNRRVLNNTFGNSYSSRVVVNGVYLNDVDAMHVCSAVQSWGAWYNQVEKRDHDEKYRKLGEIVENSLNERATHS